MKHYPASRFSVRDHDVDLFPAPRRLREWLLWSATIVLILLGSFADSL